MIIKFKNLQDFQKRIIMLGLSVRGFAISSGISTPYMSQIVNGKRNPSPQMAKKVCEGLNAEFDDIFFIENDNKSYQTA